MQRQSESNTTRQRRLRLFGGAATFQWRGVGWVIIREAGMRPGVCAAVPPASCPAMAGGHPAPGSTPPKRNMSPGWLPCEGEPAPAGAARFLLLRAPRASCASLAVRPDAAQKRALSARDAAEKPCILATVLVESRGCAHNLRGLRDISWGCRALV